MSHHITTDLPPPSPLTRPTRVRWLIFVLACLVSWFLYLHRYAWGVVKPYVREEFGLTHTQMGWLDSAFNISYAAFQIPGGLAGDIRGPALVLPLLILLWSALVGLTGLAGGFTSFFAVRLGFGAAQAGAYPNLSKVTRSWFPLSVRTTAQGLIAATAGRAGGACASLVVSTLLLGWLALGWRAALLWIAGAGILFALLFRLLFRNRPAEHPWANQAEQELVEEGERPAPPPPEAPAPPSTDIQTAPATTGIQTAPRPPAPGLAPAGARPGALALLGKPWVLFSFVFLLVHIFTSAFADQVFVYWIPQFLTEDKGLSAEAVGLFASLPLWGGALGGFAGGLLNDWLIRLTGSRRFGRVAVGLTGKVTAALLIALSLRFDDGRTMMLVVGLAKFFNDWSQPSVWGTVTDIGGPAAGRVFGTVNMAGSIGAIIAGPFFGAVVQRAGWDALFWAVVAIFLVSGLSWLAIDPNKRLVEDRPAGA